MNSLRIALALMAGVGIGHSQMLHAQPVDARAAALVVPVTFTGSGMRVPVSEARGMTILVTIEPGTFFCAEAVRAEGISSAELKRRLYEILKGRGIASLRDQIAQIQNEPDRARKFGRVFGLSDSWLSELFIARRGIVVEGDSVMQLQMAQEISVGAGLGIRCYSASQLDQINTEGLRVIQAIAQSSVPVAPASAAGPPVKPGAIQQQLNR